MLIVFGGTFVATAAVAATVVAIIATAAPQPLCRPYRPCGKPPRLAKPLVNNSIWTSSALGFQVQYDSANGWQISHGTPTSVIFKSSQDLSFPCQQSDGSTLRVNVPPGSVQLEFDGFGQPNPARLLTRATGRLKNAYQSFGRDPAPADALLGSSIGERAGVGGAYIGYATSPQGVSQQLWFDVMVAAQGSVTIVATLTSPAPAGLCPNANPIDQAADDTVNSVVWAGA